MNLDYFCLRSFSLIRVLGFALYRHYEVLNLYCSNQDNYAVILNFTIIGKLTFFCGDGLEKLIA